MRETHLQNIEPSLATAEHIEFLMLELLGNWEPPDSLYAVQIRAAVDSLLCLPSGDQSKTKKHGENKIQTGLF